MYYKVSLNGDAADRLWVRAHVDSSKDDGNFMFVSTEETPNWFTEEIARSGTGATFTPMSKQEFDTAVGFVS